jgi:GNAT superfamily N-acetyltransferase
MTEIGYRAAEKADVPALARVRARNWGTEEYWIQRLTAYMDRELHPQEALLPRVVFVAQEGDAIVGLIAGHLTRRFDCEGELEWIDVVSERRGLGIAGELLRRLATWFIAEGARRVCVDVVPENGRARAFYQRRGARPFKPSWMLWEDIGTVL